MIESRFVVDKERRLTCDKLLSRALRIWIFDAIRKKADILLRGGVDSEGITIEWGRERNEEKRGRGGEKEHLPFICIASFASSF
jgi:hypothetical protein